MPLYDRPYMRVGPQAHWRNPLLLLIGGLIGVFFIQALSGLLLGHDYVGQYLALVRPNITSGYLWTILTYAVVHDGPVHLLMNCLALFFMGMPLLGMIGDRRFVILTVLSALGGALLFLAFHIGHGQWGVVGASAIAASFLTVFCLNRMDESITLLLFFVFPVTVKPRYLLMAAVLIELVFLVGELQGTGTMAASAHLGGMLTGYLFNLNPAINLSFLKRKTVPFPGQKVTVEQRKRAPRPAQPARYRVNISNRHDLRGEVDRILDKINSQGFGSLTPEEKRLLDKARDILSR